MTRYFSPKQGSVQPCIKRRQGNLLKEHAEQPITISINEENYEIEVATANGQYSMAGISAEQYLMDICNVIPNDEMVCNISDTSRPLVFTLVQNAEYDEFLAILMPMNVTEY